MNMEASNNIERQMKEMMKLFESRINTEDLIFEVERKPAIWDPRIESYADKVEKLNSWNSILKSFIPEFEEKPVSDKNVLVTIAQKKWKSIRTCYTRELQKKKCVKSGSEAINKKQYVYFDQLRFLETLSKKTTSSIEEDDNNHDPVDTNTEEDPDRCENPSDFEKRKSKTRKRSKNEDDELIALLKRRITTEANSAEEAKDEDRHFLLSLLSEMRKVPAERKLKLRSDIISVIAAAQAPEKQHWPSNNGPLMSYPFHHPAQFSASSCHQALPFQVPPVSQYPSTSNHPHVPPQQIPPSRFPYLQTLPNNPHHQQNCLPPSLTSPPLSLPSESQALESPAQSDSSFSETSDYVLFQ